MNLNYKRTFFVGLAFLSICAFWQLYDSIIPLILSNTFQFGEAMTGFIMGLDNILALLLIPLFGTYSDKVHTRLGKRTPFIIIGTFFAVIFMMLIPYADRTQNFVLFVISLGMVLLAMGSYRAPAVALMPDVTPKQLRSKANSIINLMGAVGAIITLILISRLVKKEEFPDYTLIFVLVASLMVFSVIILLKTIHENKIAKEFEAESTDIVDILENSNKGNKENTALPKEVKRSLIFLLASIFLWFTAYNAVTTAYSRYAVKVWGLQGGSFANALLVATGAAIISYIPIGIISSIIGRKKTILIGILIMSASYFFGFLIKDYSPIIYVVFSFTGIGWSAISVNSYPMVVEMGRFSDTGKYTSLYYLFSMMAQTITPTLSGYLLEKVSFQTLFPYSLTFSLLSFCTMLFVMHGDSKPPRKGKVLENFESND